MTKLNKVVVSGQICFLAYFDWFPETVPLPFLGTNQTYTMQVLNGPKGFRVITARALFNEIISDRKPLDVQKVDLIRSRTVNTRIVSLFNEFINTPGIDQILFWYKSQNSFLCIYKEEQTGKLRFYGCNKHIEHHSSNIEWIIKPMLERMICDNAKQKLLVDDRTAALVGFGLLPLFNKETSGNQLQGHTVTYTCNVRSFKVSLSDEQIMSARAILRLIKKG